MDELRNTADDYLCDSSLNFHSDLFPDIEDFDLSPSGIDVDSDDSNSLIDVGGPEAILNTRNSAEADTELVSYLTGSGNAPVSSGVKVLRVLNGKQSHTDFTNQPRVMKIDSAGNKRMLHAIRVNQPARIIRVNTLAGVSEERNESALSDCRSLSKSAIAARENREKKKKYIGDLEKAVKDLSDKNKTLEQQNEAFSAQTTALQKEVRYLKSVLANQSTLSRLLQNIPGIQDITFKTNAATDNSHPKRKTSVLTTSDHQLNAKRARRQSACATTEPEQSEANAGVCLHVSGSTVSLEFCPDCNENAKSSRFHDN